MLVNNDNASINENTILRKAYKFRLKIKQQEVKEQLANYANCCRFIWNYFLYVNKRRLENRWKIMRYYEMSFWLTLLKKSEEYKFLSEVPREILAQKLIDLDKAYANGFNKKRLQKMPTKHHKNLHNSFRMCISNIKQQTNLENRLIDDNRIKIPLIGWLYFYKSREIIGRIKNLTLSQKNTHWYVSIQTEQQLEIKKKIESNPIGIHNGITKFATCATLDKELIFLPKNSFKYYEAKIAKEQKKLTNKERFSKSWINQQNKIRKIYTKLTNIRKDHLDKISTDICKNYSTIFIEDLKVSKMTKSARGTIKDPGKNVQVKANLNKLILDQGWNNFKQKIDYKSKWNGDEVFLVNPAYTSQQCSKCGHIAEENRPTPEEFICQKCGLEIDADINAAKNILAIGLIKQKEAKLEQLKVSKIN